ncbi:cytochrome-c peroxidase [Algoriphagus chordae]|uniref:Cytochrome c peroxidase n=1 Tax=Algoriphagus chordae TaxID=237019 RepID=A0A2W7QXY2_9BACT|nr:cytochrome c peroxidase [Algoriphagus chordae]PZX48547.1 cytochrome c peroxidase [Algoriphagus chordae]
MRFQFPSWLGLIGMCGLISCGNTEEEPITGPTQISLDAPDYFPSTIAMPTDNPLTAEGVQLGRMLFYEKKLSADGTVSCGSCHQQQKAFSDGNQFSFGVSDSIGDMNSMSLSNLHWQTKFFWNGRAISLEDQAIQPIEDEREMNLPIEEAVNRLQADAKYPSLFKNAFGTSEISSNLIGKALSQFERTLISANSKFDAWIRNEVELSPEEQLGLELFFTHPEPTLQLRGGNCSDCHIGFLTAGDSEGLAGFHNNGLDSEENLSLGLMEITGNSFDRGKFKAPGLRNIALTAPYMHDGRFQTLEEVLDHYNGHIQNNSTLDVLILEASNELPDGSGNVKLHLSDDEKAAIIAFLHTLTDQQFIANPKFSDPFN